MFLSYKNLMHSIFRTILPKNITLEIYLFCMLFSIILGGIIAFTASRKKNNSKTLEVSLVIMPAIVQTIVMMVNGNIGTGVAVAGAFTLIRFTSATGTAKDISLVFLAMTVGIATGTGYLGIAIFLTVIICIVVLIVYRKITQNEKREYLLKLVIVREITTNYDEILDKYILFRELICMKVFCSENIKKVYYHIILRNDIDAKLLVSTIEKNKDILEVSYEKYLKEESTL